MRGLNKIFLMGHLGQTPEIKQTANGKSYTDLKMATNRAVLKGEQWTEQADWHQVRVWERTAEQCSNHLSKGSPIAVEGQLRTDNWTNKDGEHRSRTYVLGDRVHFLPNGGKALEPDMERM